MKRVLMMTAAASAVVLGLAACGSDAGDESMLGMNTSSAPSTSSTAAQDREHNEADVMFAQMMIPHHTQAVEMSEIALGKDGVDERVLELAQRIKDEQAPEIEQLTGWLEAWGAEVPDMSMGSMGGMEGMDHGGSSMSGMMSEEDMKVLEDADGPTASGLFLEQMIEHHTGAIEMAQTELNDGQNPQALELAQTIIDAQQAEISEMEDLLADL